MSERNAVEQERDPHRHIGRNGAPLRRARTVHYSDVEWQAIQEAARLCGKAARRFVRDTSLGALPKVPPLLANAELVRELGRSGNAIARLAATARASGALPEAATLNAALAELLAIVRQLAPTRSAAARNDQRPE